MSLSLERVDARSPEVTPRPANIIIDRGTREAWFDGRRKVIYGEINWTLFTLLARYPTDFISRSTIKEVLRGVGSKSKSPSTVLGNLRRLIEVRPSKPEIILGARYGDETRYGLWGHVEFRGVEGRGVVRMESYHTPFDITLPDGQIVRTLGERRSKLLTELAKPTEDSVATIPVTELCRKVYGDDSQRTTHALIRLTEELNENVLDDTQYRVVHTITALDSGHPIGAYILEKIGDNEMKINGHEIRGLTFFEKKILLRLLNATPDSPVNRTELAKILYERKPGEGQDASQAKNRLNTILSHLRTKLRREGFKIRNLTPSGDTRKGSLYYIEGLALARTKEKGKVTFFNRRSEDETKLLQYVISRVVLGYQMRFDELFEKVSKLEIGPIGKPGYRVVHAVKLKGILNSAMRKLHIEAEIAFDDLSSDDKKLWGHVQLAAQRLARGDVGRLLGKVSLLIYRAENRFWREYPVKNGKVDWVYL